MQTSIFEDLDSRPSFIFSRVLHFVIICRPRIWNLMSSAMEMYDEEDAYKKDDKNIIEGERINSKQQNEDGLQFLSS